MNNGNPMMPAMLGVIAGQQAMQQRQLVEQTERLDQQNRLIAEQNWWIKWQDPTYQAQFAFAYLTMTAEDRAQWFINVFADLDKDQADYVLAIISASIDDDELSRIMADTNDVLAAYAEAIERDQRASHRAALTKSESMARTRSQLQTLFASCAAVTAVTIAILAAIGPAEGLLFVLFISAFGAFIAGVGWSLAPKPLFVLPFPEEEPPETEHRRAEQMADGSVSRPLPAEAPLHPRVSSPPAPPPIHRPSAAPDSSYLLRVPAVPPATVADLRTMSRQRNPNGDYSVHDRRPAVPAAGAEREARWVAYDRMVQQWKRDFEPLPVYSMDRQQFHARLLREWDDCQAEDQKHGL